jgi:hypothetical protein
MMFQRCGEKPAREKSPFCSPRCSQANWYEKNRDKVNKRMRGYMREQYKRRKPSDGWEARREAIIEKYGATRQWNRKVMAQEVSG